MPGSTISSVAPAPMYRMQCTTPHAVYTVRVGHNGVKLTLTRPVIAARRMYFSDGQCVSVGFQTFGIASDWADGRFPKGPRTVS